MHTPDEYWTLARLDYDEGVKQLVAQGYTSPSERFLCSIAQALLAQAPKKRRLPWKH